MNPVMGSKMAGMERHQNHRPLQDADEDKTRHVSICVHSSKGRIVYFFAQEMEVTLHAPISS